MVTVTLAAIFETLGPLSATGSSHGGPIRAALGRRGSRTGVTRCAAGVVLVAAGVEARSGCDRSIAVIVGETKKRVFVAQCKRSDGESGGWVKRSEGVV